MIDISLKHAASIVRPLDEEVALNYGYYGELSSLNLSIKDDAEYAIKKWLVPSYLNPENYKETEQGLFLRKEACRFKITLNHPFGAAWLPGIDIAGDVYVEDIFTRRKYQNDLMKFQLLLWEHRFPSESFKIADLENYRNRIDSGFTDFPDYPRKWGKPEYAAWPWKDRILHRSIYIYCFLLPFGLLDSIGTMTPVIVCFVAYTFFALEALGAELEHPFGMEANDLALDAMVYGIESSVLEMLGDVPRAKAPEVRNFVLH